MSKIARRAVLAGIPTSVLVGSSMAATQPVRIGLLSDMSGPYRDTGGPGSRIAAELAVQDFGGSVLGRPIEVLQVDDQNKADLAGALARDWIDNKGVDVLADGAGTSAGLAIQQIAREKKRIYLITGPASSDFTGKMCSPYGIQFVWDSYALAHATGNAVTKAGGEKWFFITADYAFGTAMQRDATVAIESAGGKVLGSVRTPVGTTDFSSPLLQAQASGATVIGLAIAGTDIQNCIKQVAEFGLNRKGMQAAALVLQVTDLVSLGQEASEGLVFANSFYWNMSDGSRAWTKRYMSRIPAPPTEQHAGTYCAVLHWLKAAAAVNTLDALIVAEKMKATPINDFYNQDVLIRSDGRVMHEMYLWQVKPKTQAAGPYDFCKRLALISPSEAWRPLTEGGCSLS
jgi:branched-chain amino acid transport system substrate-binding protein